MNFGSEGGQSSTGTSHPCVLANEYTNQEVGNEAKFDADIVREKEAVIHKAMPQALAKLYSL